MQFQMPRYLDIKDKVIGPLTFEQFIYLAGGFGLSYVVYKYLGFIWGFPLIVIFAGLGLSLSFWKPNERSALVMFQAFIRHYTKNHMFVWQRPNKNERVKKEEVKIEENFNKVLDNSKVESLAWSLDILDKNPSSHNTVE